MKWAWVGSVQSVQRSTGNNWQSGCHNSIRARAAMHVVGLRDAMVTAFQSSWIIHSNCYWFSPRPTTTPRQLICSLFGLRCCVGRGAYVWHFDPDLDVVKRNFDLITCVKFQRRGWEGSRVTIGCALSWPTRMGTTRWKGCNPAFNRWGSWGSWRAICPSYLNGFRNK